MENWLPVKGFEAIYEVSDCGNVRRVGRDHVLRGDLNRGYRRVLLSRGGQYTRVFVHRLVVIAFIGDIPEGYEPNHKNAVRLDNRPENLEIVTRRQNVLHTMAIGHFTPQQGSLHGRSKLKEADVLEIRHLRSTGMPLKEIAARFSVNVPMISLIVNRKNWTHI